MRKNGLSDAIMAVLSVSDEPMTAYEVFEFLPDLKVAVYPAQVICLLKTMVRRGKIGSVSVHEKHGRNFVRYRYFFKGKNNV